MNEQTNLTGITSGTFDYEALGKNLEDWSTKGAWDPAEAFVGLAADSVEQMTKLINDKIITPAEETIEGFGNVQNELITAGFKGDVVTSISGFIDEAKAALTAYVQSYQSFNDLMEKVYKAYQQNDEGNAGIVENAAQDLQHEAQNIYSELNN